MIPPESNKYLKLAKSVFLKYSILSLFIVFVAATMVGNKPKNSVIRGVPLKNDIPDSILNEKAVIKDGINRDVIVEETFLPWLDKQDSINSINMLRRNLDRIIKKHDKNRSKVGVAVYSVDRGDFIYTHRSEELFTPASTTKLFTVMSAFYLRGDKGTIDTELYTNGYLDMDTVLIGDLFIRGQGNVFLEGDHIKVLADRVRDMGIRKVDGNIYIDEGFFDGKTDRFKYSGDADVVQKLPPIRPLILSDANLKITVQAGDIVGQPVNYSFYPSSTVFHAENEAIVSGSRSQGEYKFNKTNIDFGSIESKTNYDISERQGDNTGSDYAEYTDLAKRHTTQSKSGIKVTQLLYRDTLQKYNINGKLPSGSSAFFTYPINNMQLAIAGTLEYWLQYYGIEITGDIDEKSINGYEKNRIVRIAKHSFPLVEMAMPVNKKSDNFVAEQMFKFNGGNRNNSNNYAGAREVFLDMLDSLKIECEGCRLNDGSGLSRRGLLKPRAMVELLEASTRKPFHDKLRSTLAIAGVDGTIRNRMKNSKANNNLRAKTGTLRNVSALSGFIVNQDGETYIFSILSNGSSPYQFKRMEDEIGTALAEFFYTDKNGKRR